MCYPGFSTVLEKKDVGKFFDDQHWIIICAICLNVGSFKKKIKVSRDLPYQPPNIWTGQFFDKPAIGFACNWLKFITK